jgi:hypothetical protein
MSGEWVFVGDDRGTEAQRFPAVLGVHRGNFQPAEAPASEANPSSMKQLPGAAS